MQAAKMNINYSEVYKLILNPQLPKYHLSKSKITIYIKKILFQIYIYLFLFV